MMSTFNVKIHKQAIVLLALGAAGFACGNAPVLIHDDSTAAGSGGGTGGDATGTAGAGGGCAGQCAPLAPGEWLGPLLLWIGKEGEAPECPPTAPVRGSPVFDDLNAPTACGACKCDAPSGSCALPTSLTAYNSASCPAGAVPTPFYAPAGWDGSCTTANAIPAKLMCLGGNCVQALTIAPLALTEEPCAVGMEPVAAKLPYTWGTMARSCHGLSSGSCASPSEICAPAVEPGFAQCLVRNGDKECPEAYSVKHVFHDSFSDTRACTPCACSAPIGGTCTALVSVFSDGACSQPSLVVAGTIDATGSACLDVLPSGQALLSKAATPPVYSPGVCQVSGGEPMGQALPEEPSTYCCLP